MKKKILILICDAGNCHRMAAQSIVQTFYNLYPNQYEVKFIDLFKTLDIEPFNTSDISYAIMTQNTFLEKIDSFFYKITNTSIGFDIFSSYVNSKLLLEAENLIKEEGYDIIISDHPVVSIVLKALKERLNTFKSVELVLDLITLHRGWGDTKADLLISPTTDAVNTLVKYGVDVSKIVYPLFPFKPELKNYRSKQEVFSELGFDINIPTIFITGGGVGTRILKKVIKRIVGLNKYQLIIVAGKLDYFKEELTKQFENNKLVKVLGFINNMQDYYNACDVLIAKPSAATIMESELFEKKAIWTRKIGECDSGNPGYIIRNPKFRYIGDDWGKIEEMLEELISSSPRDPVNHAKRSFDESEKIVKEIIKLIN